MPLASPSTLPVRAFPITFRLRHYEAAEDVNWHVQLQVTRASDPTFASRLTDFDLDTSSDQTGWSYRDDQLDATDGTFAAWPSGGVATQRSGRDRDNDDATVALARYYVSTASLLRQLEYNEPILIRARQSADGGTTWGDWFAWTRRV